MMILMQESTETQWSKFLADLREALRNQERT